MSSFTQDQEKAINNFGKNTLVSASAGSGKTTILKEKVTNMVTNKTNLGKAIDIDRMIIVTYTKASARDLKNKIFSALSDAIAKGDYDLNKLREQIDSIPLSNISTIHSLCARLIREYFNVLDGIDPAFGIMEDSESEMLLLRAINTVISKMDIDMTKEYAILRQYLKYDLSNVIKKVYYAIQNQIEPEKFLKDSIYNLYDEEDINNLNILFDYRKNIENRLVNISNKADETILLLDAIKIENYQNIQQKQIDVIKKYILGIKEIADFLLKDRSYNGLIDNYNQAKQMLSIKQPQQQFTALCEYEEFSPIKDFQIAAVEFKSWLRNVNLDIEEELNKKRKTSSSILKVLMDIELQVIDEYSLIKARERKLDFNDLEHNMLKLLKIDEIREELQNRFDFICVDEYQDINEVQEKILTTISNGKNLFMVGDLKQSIYSFRNADPDVFANKYKKYKEDTSEGLAVNLNVNFRSRVEIINIVNEIFNNIMTEDFGGLSYEKDSQLNLGATYPNVDTKEERVNICLISNSSVESQEEEIKKVESIYSVKNYTQQYFGSSNGINEGKYIASKIKEMIDKKYQISCGGNETRDVQYYDIAILFRSRNSTANNIVKKLIEAGIPVDATMISKNNKNESIDLIISYLDIINNIQQDIPLCAVLTSPLVGLTLTDLTIIKQNVSSKSFLYEALEKYDKQDNIKKKIDDFYLKLNKYRFESKFKPASKIIEQIEEDYLLDELILSKEEGEIELTQFKSFIANIQFKQYDISISSLLSMIKEYEKLSDINASKPESDNCVKIITLHASKGLEYPIVFLANVSKDFKKTDSGEKILVDKKYGISIKDIDVEQGIVDNWMFYDYILQNKKYREKEEELRDFYVALTRAKEYLYITGEVKNSNIKDKFDKSTPQSCNSYLEWILYAMKHSQNEYLLKAYKEININDIEDINNDNKEFIVDEEDSKITDILNNYLEDNYEHIDSTNHSLLWSATEINKLARMASDVGGDNMILDIDRAYYSSSHKNKKINTTEEGIAYHKVLELIGFDCYSVEDVEDRLDDLLDNGMITKEQADIVDAKIIFKCLDNEYIKKARYSTPEREKKFSLLIPAKEILPNTKIEDKVFVRGAIDLFIPKSRECDENILVDFKYSSEDEETIKKTYMGQLKVYEMALESCYNIKLDRKIIYVIGQDKVIEFPLNEENEI